MDVEKKKQVNYLRFLDSDVCVDHHVVGPLEHVPDRDVVDLGDDISRYNLRKQIRLRKKVMACMHGEIRSLESLLDEDV